MRRQTEGRGAVGHAFRDRRKTARYWPHAVVLALACATLGAACRSKPHGPNDAYHDPKTTAEEWNRLFEGDAREVYQKRAFVMNLMAAKPGMTVADVGAGTGAFTMLLSDAVGPGGRIYAEEVIDKFSRYIAEKAAREKRYNVVSVVGTETSAGLPEASIDLVILCDVYHHFDHPREMLASIRRALREEGELFLVEFRREPGRSAPWVFEHVRAGEDVVVREIEETGFVAVWRDDRLRDNYVRRFRRSPANE